MSEVYNSVGQLVCRQCLQPFRHCSCAGGPKAAQAMLHLGKKQFVYKFAARVEKVNWHPNTIYILFVCELTSSWEICKEGRVCQWAQVVEARNCSIEPKVGDTRWRSEVNGRDCERARLSTSKIVNEQQASREWSRLSMSKSWAGRRAAAAYPQAFDMCGLALNQL